MAAPEGNDYNKKFKTSEERIKLCLSYCSHMMSGLSKESFPDCDMQTFKWYREHFPEDFDTDLIDRSHRMAHYFWENIGIQGTTGKIPGFNAKSWEFNMKNRWGWKDRQDITSNDEPISFVITRGENPDGSSQS